MVRAVAAQLDFGMDHNVSLRSIFGLYVQVTLIVSVVWYVKIFLALIQIIDILVQALLIIRQLIRVVFHAMVQIQDRAVMSLTILLPIYTLASLFHQDRFLLVYYLVLLIQNVILSPPWHSLIHHSYLAFIINLN